jgi:hypothetical protein
MDRFAQGTVTALNLRNNLLPCFSRRITCHIHIYIYIYCTWTFVVSVCESQAIKRLSEWLLIGGIKSCRRSYRDILGIKDGCHINHTHTLQWRFSNLLKWYWITSMVGFNIQRATTENICSIWVRFSVTCSNLKGTYRFSGLLEVLKKSSCVYDYVYRKKINTGYLKKKMD